MPHQASLAQRNHIHMISYNTEFYDREQNGMERNGTAANGVLNEYGKGSCDLISDGHKNKNINKYDIHMYVYILYMYVYADV